MGQPVGVRVPPFAFFPDAFFPALPPLRGPAADEMRHDLVKVNVIEQPACRRVLEIEVPAEEIDRHREDIVDEYRKSITLPGFRKGKAPREIVKQRIAETLQEEILKRAIPAAYQEAVSESQVHPASDPQVQDLQYKEGEPLRFNVHVEIWPQVTLEGYKEIPLAAEEFEIEEAEVQRQLDQLAESRAAMEKTERPAQMTDVLSVEYWLLNANGERGELKQGLIELNGPGTPEPFNSGLLNAAAGESRRVVLPATSHTTESGEVHQHPEQLFDVLVKEVREKKIPVQDDAFANAVMGAEAAGGLEELKKRIRAHSEAEEARRSRQALEEALYDQLLSRTNFDIPEGIVKSELDEVVNRARKEHPTLSDKDEAQLREAYRPGIERSLRVELILAAAGRQENVRLEEDEVDAEIKRYAEREGKSVAEVKGRLRRTDAMDRLRNDMYKHKVIEKLLELATVETTRKRRS